ncbi:MAG: hypothetical protein FJ221_10290 [Lentisphaerae bacterium]|nr:hypothetical protein [Lentisphaerota bacterium]
MLAGHRLLVELDLVLVHRSRRRTRGDRRRHPDCQSPTHRHVRFSRVAAQYTRPPPAGNPKAATPRTGEGDVQHPTPNTQHPTANTQRRTSNIEHRTPNAQHPTPNTEHPTPSAQQPTSNSQQPTSNSQHPTPNIEHPTSNAQ